MPSRLRGVFITGTDTGVGKTWVAEHLIRDWRKRGVEDVRPLKPVESGCVQTGEGADAPLRAEDAERLRAAAGLDELRPIVLHHLRAAIAPTLAAEREGVDVRLDDLVEFCHRDGTLVVEGAGGWRSPLAADGDGQALAVKLELPVLVVAEDRLGAINQILLTCAAVQAAPCRLAGVVLNERRPQEEDFGNLEYLQKHLRDVRVWQTRPEQWLSAEDAREVREVLGVTGAGV